MCLLKPQSLFKTPVNAGSYKEPVRTFIDMGTLSTLLETIRITSFVNFGSPWGNYFTLKCFFL